MKSPATQHELLAKVGNYAQTYKSRVGFGTDCIYHDCFGVWHETTRNRHQHIYITFYSGSDQHTCLNLYTDLYPDHGVDSDAATHANSIWRRGRQDRVRVI